MAFTKIQGVLRVKEASWAKQVNHFQFMVYYSGKDKYQIKKGIVKKKVRKYYKMVTIKNTFSAKIEDPSIFSE